VTETQIRVAFAAVLAAMAAYCATRVELSTNVTNFMPEKSRGEFAVLASKLADSRLTRTMILTIGGADAAARIAASRELAEALAADPEVASVAGGLDPDQLEQAYRLYFPRRHAFFSAEPEREVAALSDAALRARARALRGELAQPTATLVKRVAAADPLGAFERVAARLRGDAATLRSEAGRFVTADGRFAVLFLTTRASAFDSKPQAAFLQRLEASFAAIAARHGGGLTLEASGPNRFAVAAEESIRRDVVVIATTALAGVAAVFLSLLRSLRFFALAMFPPLVGVLAGVAATHLVFGRVDALTVAFGASLVGVADDYSIHVIDHCWLDRAGAPRAVTRRLLPSLLLAAGTTIASFAGLLLTSFPGFQEIGFFAIVGVSAALATTFWVLPGFLELRSRPPDAPRFARRAARALGDAVLWLAGRRLLLVAALLLAALVTAVAVPRLHFVDDLSRLMAMDASLRAEDTRVRERVAREEGGRVVVALGDDADAAVARNDEVAARLAAARERGELEGYRSLHALLWSRALQERNLAAFAAAPDLAGRVEAAFAAEGFRPAALAPFRASLEAPAPEPLDAAALLASPLGGPASAFLLDLGGSTAAVTYLRGVADPALLARSLEGLPHVHVFDSRSFLNQVYREFRVTTLVQTAVGSLLVVLVLALRYRRWRPALAVLLPSAAAAGVLLAGFAAFGMETNLLHVTSLVMVMGMGVDYGVFLVDSAGDREEFDATMLSILLSCLTTVFVFGTLALSGQPVLRAIGVTTGGGILLSFLLAPLTFALVRPPGTRS
jgi:predicted exporter